MREVPTQEGPVYQGGVFFCASTASSRKVTGIGVDQPLLASISVMMTIAPLISLAGVAGAAIAGAASALGDVSFAELFSGESSPSPAPAAEELPFVSKLESLPTTLAEMQEESQRALERFQKAFAAKLAEAGIALDEPLKLSIDSFGKIRETSGHPQAAEIDDLLSEHNQMTADFRRGVAHAETARAVREHSEFSKLYAQNPELAVQVYSHLFDDHRQPPQLSVQLDGDVALPIFE